MTEKQFTLYRQKVFEVLKKEYGFAPPIRDIEIKHIDISKDTYIIRTCINEHYYDIHINEKTFYIIKLT